MYTCKFPRVFLFLDLTVWLLYRLLTNDWHKYENKIKTCLGPRHHMHAYPAGCSKGRWSSWSKRCDCPCGLNLRVYDFPSSQIYLFVGFRLCLRVQHPLWKQTRLVCFGTHVVHGCIYGRLLLTALKSFKRKSCLSLWSVLFAVIA